VTLFVYLMSRNLGWTALALVTFATLAVVYRPRPGQEATPLLPAMAAVTFSTMHQSSLGSLFLLMPDKVHPLWWSPLMPLLFLVSAVAAGCAVVVLVELWMARVYQRRTPLVPLAALGKVVAVALLLAWVLRLGDLIAREQLLTLKLDGRGLLFLTELVFGGVLPLALLWPAALRQRKAWLALGTLLAAAGVVLHRTSVVLLAMNLKGPMPQVVAPAPYSPSLVEWGLSVGLIATTVFLFGLGVRNLPVLPREEPVAGRAED
jgi:formate dehydrogenase iron-sulfur subunit